MMMTMMMMKKKHHVDPCPSVSTGRNFIALHNARVDVCFHHTIHCRYKLWTIINALGYLLTRFDKQNIYKSMGFSIVIFNSRRLQVYSKIRVQKTVSVQEFRQSPTGH